jgi:histidinol-phosphate aminotransferase
LAQVAAVAALEDEAYIKASQKVSWDGLDQIYQGLDELVLNYLESQANFVLFDTEREAHQVYEQLLRKGLILRPVGNYGLPHHLRWTVGLADENQIILEALKEILAKIPPVR